MRIIVVNDHGSVTGGAAQVAIASLNGLAEIGEDVTFLSSVGPVDWVNINPRVRVINFGFEDLLGNQSRLNAAIHGIWDLRCARAFGMVLNEYNKNDTIIHLHTWVKALSASVIHEALKRGFKIVVTLHDYFSVCPNGGLYNFSTHTHCLIKPMSISCALENCDSRNYTQKIWRFMRHMMQIKIGGMPTRIDNFIFVSDYSKNLMIPYFRTDAKLFQVRNPISIPRLPLSTESKSNIFTFVGRLSSEKGGAVFAAAAKKANVRAVFVGQGSEKDWILKIYPNAEILGWKDRSDVISCMKASRAVVFPSLLHETQGLVVAEAAALGIPCIVSDGCAAREGVVDGVSGLLFRSGDVDDLSRKISMLNSDQALALRLGQAAYIRYWADPSTLERHVLELMECYGRIMNES